MLRLLPFAAALTSGAQARRHKYNTNAQRTNAPGVLNVHVISHTHDDVGWLKTVDEYYAGLNNTIQHAGVRHILDSTMDSLAKNPDRKFIYVEQAFFQRWYAEQDEEQKAQVQKFVEQGRLSFVNGGWCMHDEATTSYVDMVDQTQLGHRFIVSEFGQAALPSVTWQIDPFGHSGTQASLLSSPASGYSALFVSRADYADIQARTKTKSLEYIWQASNSLGSQASTFFSIMNLGLHLYFPLPGLCWDALNCNDPEVQDDPELDDYNVDSVVATTVNSAQSLAASYVGDVYLTQGFDFNYEYAEEWFINIDKMIHYVNLNTSIHGVNMFYSTPQEYARAKLAYPVTWPSKVNDDGFPYADGPHSYWTGFFSSRQALKGYVRDTSSYFQAAKQIQAIAKPMYDLDPSNPLYTLMRAMGVAQHHDAVAGTEQQHVAFDYAKRLARGRLASDAFLMNSIPSLLGLEGVEALTCDLANATICPALESLAPAVVFVYNSQAQAKGALPIRIPVGTGSGAQSWAVYLGHPSQGKSVQAQLLPLSAADTDLRANYYSYTGNAPSTSWLAFQAPVPAVGLAAFVIVPSASIGDEHVSQPVSVNAADQTLTNGLVTLTISVTTGQLSHVSVPSLGVNADMTMDWLWYNASVGNADDGQASGAYIFRPNSSTPLSVIPQGFTPTTTIVSGPVVSEARQVIAPWVTAVIRLWAGRTDWDIEYTVGPVPFSDGLGKEIVVRYNVPSLQTNGTCYTDSNGRDLYKRVRNYRPSWNATIHEPVAGNYYPVNAGMLASDVASGMTLWVANDRSQGGGSIVDGSVELMVQRRLQADDQRGVSQPLNETGLTGAGLVVRGVHRVGVNPSTNAIAALRAAMQDVALFRPLITYGGVPAAIPVANVSALSAPLPPNVHLLTLQSLSDKVLMLRVAHLFGVGEVAVLSSNATVDLATMFKDRTFSDCSEYTLPGGQPLASVAPVHYQVEGQGTVRAPATPQDAEQKVTEGGSRKRLTAMPVTLSPLQGRHGQILTWSQPSQPRAKFIRVNYRMRWTIGFYEGLMPMPTSYNGFFVALGLAVAILGAYSTLTFMESLVASALAMKAQRKGSTFWSVLAAAMTVSVNTVFLMHFISASSLSHGSLPVKYELGETMLSMLYIFLGTALAFALVGFGPGGLLSGDERAKASNPFIQLYFSRPHDSAPWSDHWRHLRAQVRQALGWRLLAAGSLVGTGILAMHFTGMASMRAHMLLVFSPYWIGLSPLPGIAGGVAAMLIMLTCHGAKRRGVAAVIFGIAVDMAHWYGMQSGTLYPLPPGMKDDSRPSDVLVDAKVACVVIALLSSIVRFALSGAIAVSSD